MTLLGSYYPCAHFADGEMESLIGLNSCEVAELTAEIELLAPPQMHMTSTRYRPRGSKPGLGPG